MLPLPTVTGAVRIPALVGAGTGGAAEPSVISTQAFAAKIKVEKTSKGSHILRGLRIFKKGTFKDSMGMERTWEDTHLEQMAFHYTLLKDGGFLPNVPVRVDHSFSVQNVAGYFLNVYREKDDSSFLAADVEITEPDAYAKWERGTYRSRSLEVGMYETNDGAMYWPVILGLAFVDIPAVEGLHGRSQGDTAYFSQTLQDNDKEKDMSEGQGQGAGTGEGQGTGTGTPGTEGQGTGTGTGDGGTGTGTPGTGTGENGGGAAGGGDGAGDAGGNGGTSTGTGDTGGTGEGAGGGAPASHSRPPAGTPFTFRVNGQPVTDFNAVQQHITVLENFRSETSKTNKHSFVDKLVADGKIGANQLDEFKAHVETLDDSGFASFSKLWEKAPKMSILSPHGFQPNGDGNNNGGGSTPNLQEQFEIEKQTVEQLQRSGMTKEQIEKSSAFQRMTTLQAQLSGQSA